ncbi:MAG: poly-gamma-glutamate biosynthesis protein PgsC/CapC [Myxococcota bacterium]|nr:poly-gamma-glutamate biosynthesis protein PgsC/CapC [Myxococcota bacterium]
MFSIFPAALVDNSLLTAVLVGVVLLWWMAERFGWPATGLVVPGYVGAVLCTRPEAALVILLESVITYGVAHLVGRLLPRWLPWDRSFGRDRFFLIILASIAVRVLVEGEFGQGLLAGTGLSLSQGWHSLGLVLVPLTANAFWKPGLGRGLPLVVLPTLVVYALLRFVLLPLTNLDFAQFELTYEDLRFSFLEAPREYVMVLLGTLIASHATNRYGWDFGGIIVCGLLAISWLTPAKLVATLAEVTLVVFLLRGLTRFSPLRSANLTGLRPIVLAFALSYLVKLVVAWIFQGTWPGFRIGEVFGFGYLLPAIISVRVYRYKGFARVLVPALGISLVAFILGQALGIVVVELRGGDLPEQEQHLASSRALPATQALHQHLVPPPASPLRVDNELSIALSAARSGRGWSGEQLEVQALEGGALLHSGDSGAAGVAWFRPKASGGLELVVPDAVRTPGLAEAAVAVAETLDAELVLLSPSEDLQRQAHRRGRLVMELRAGEATELLANKQLPQELDLAALTRLVPQPNTRFDLDSGALDLALSLSEADRLRLALESGSSRYVGSGRGALWDPESGPRPTEHDPRGGLEVGQLALLERGVLRPILLAMQGGDPGWLRVASSHAEALGLVLQDDGEVVSLAPQDSTEPPRFTLYLRRGGEPLAIEVRSAGRHSNADKVGLGWWGQSDAMALLVHDSRADLDAAATTRAGAFAPELAVLLTLTRELPGLQVLALTAAREDEVPGAQAVVSLGRPVLPVYDAATELMWTARGLVHHAGGRSAWYDADVQRIRFYDPANPRRDAVRAAGGEYVTVYLDPVFRLRYAGIEPDSPLRAMLDHAGIPVSQGSLEQALRGLEQPIDAVFGPSLSSLVALSATGHPEHLKVLAVEARSQGIQVSAFFDPLSQLTYLRLDKGGATVIAPMGLSEGSVDPRFLPGPELPTQRGTP